MAVEKCLGCMRTIDGDLRCPYCGFSVEDYTPPEVLRPKTPLNNRYLVGKQWKSDGEGITYLGVDAKTGEGVFIREYMPTQLCSRQGQELVMIPGSETKFKALKSDFLDMYQSIAALGTVDNIIRVFDLFEQNQTIYAVYHYFTYMSLTQYVNENAGELDWDAASALMKPVLETLTLIHHAGIIHRGLSPETIVVADDRLIITDFELCSARILNSELSPNMYSGYAAPEQYSKMMPHGEWTDVYGISAVIYKVLSGTMPPEAPTRAVNDNLISLSSLNDTVPQAVSRAIEQGMVYHANQRTRSIRDLITNLYRAREMNSSTMIFATDSMPALNEPDDFIPTETEQIDTFEDIDSGSAKKGKGKDGKKGKMKPWQKTLLICAPFVVLIIFLLYFLIFGPTSCGGDDDSALSAVSSDSSSSDSSSEVSSDENSGKVTVIDFAGKKYEEILTNPDYTDKFSFTSRLVYDDSVEEGRVISQNIKSGTKVNQNSEIILSVSKGPQMVNVPNIQELNAMTSSECQEYFTSKGFTCTVEKEYSDDVKKGNVSNLNGVTPGQKVNRDQVKNITIIESLGEEPKQESSSDGNDFLNGWFS